MNDMNSLTLQQETALSLVFTKKVIDPRISSISWIQQALVALRDQEMIETRTDNQRDLVSVECIRSEGSEHYIHARAARRWFKQVSNEADCLMMILASQDAEKRKSEDGPILVSTDFGKPAYYAELSRCGLLEVKWADDSPYLVTVTDEGRVYANGWFQEQMDMRSQNINFAPNINTNVSTTANAEAEVRDVTIGTTVGALIDLDVEQHLKDAAQEAVKQLEKAAKEKDKTKFAEKLEKIASIAKSSAEIAGVVLPFIQTTIKSLLS